MMLPPILQNLTLPVIGAPLYIISDPTLVIAQCKAGIIGAFPALNAREEGELEQWLRMISEALDQHNQTHPDHPAAPWAVNQIVHHSNTRLEQDIALCTRYRVPITITSLGAREEVNQAAHSYGGLTLHDVIHNNFAQKAIAKGADGLIAVSAGAGGHGGFQSPFALVQEIREWFDGPILLAGAIATGGSILAAQAMGADLAYIGSAFIATTQSRAQEKHKQMIVESSAKDIVNSTFFTGIAGNYLKPSVKMATGLDPDHLPIRQKEGMHFDVTTGGGGTSGPQPWRDIWSAGQGIGAIKSVVSVEELVARLRLEYQAARAKLGAE